MSCVRILGPHTFLVILFVVKGRPQLTILFLTSHNSAACICPVSLTLYTSRCPTITLTFLSYPVPPAEAGADAIMAILHNYPSHIKNLTIKLQWPIQTNVSRSTNEDDIQQIIQKATADHAVRSLFTIIHNLPTVLQSCNLEIDIGTIASSVTEILRVGPAMRFVAEKLRSFLDDGWPAFSRNVNFVWRSPGEQHNCQLSREILTALPSFLRDCQQDQAKLTEDEVTEMEGWIEKLFRSAVVTSRWKSY